MLFKNKKSQSTSRGQRSYNRAPVTTYYRSKNQPSQTSPFSRRPTKRNYSKFLLGIADIILILLLISVMIYSLLVKPAPKVEVNDLSYHSSQTYKSQLASQFAMLKNRNKITFDNKTVSDYIQKQFPEVEKTNIELPFVSQQAIVRLNISQPAFKLVSAGKVYIIDSQGVAVTLADRLPKLKNLITLNDQTGYTVVEGKQVLSSSAVDFIKAVILQTKNTKVPVSSLTLPALAQEMRLRTTDKPYYVKFYLGGDANLQTGQFLAARHDFDASAQNPAEYLDVRVDGKIFYK